MNTKALKSKANSDLPSKNLDMEYTKDGHMVQCVHPCHFLCIFCIFEK